MSTGITLPGFVRSKFTSTGRRTSFLLITRQDGLSRALTPQRMNTGCHRWCYNRRLDVLYCCDDAI